MGKVGMQGLGRTAWESWVGEGRLEKDGGREGWESWVGGKGGGKAPQLLPGDMGGVESA